MAAFDFDSVPKSAANKTSGSIRDNFAIYLNDVPHDSLVSAVAANGFKPFCELILSNCFPIRRGERKNCFYHRQNLRLSQENVDSFEGMIK